MRLRDWREAQMLTQQALAKNLGCAQATVHRWETGHRRPHPHQMIRIVAITGGAVTANDFYDLPVPPAAELEREVAA